MMSSFKNYTVIPSKLFVFQAKHTFRKKTGILELWDLYRQCVSLVDGLTGFHRKLKAILE